MKAIIFFSLLAISLGFFSNQISKRFRLVMLGKPEYRNDHPFDRLVYLFKRVFLQQNLRDYPLSAISHFLMMWGFVLLTLSSIDMAFYGLFQKHIPFLGTNAVFLFLRDLFLVLTAVGICGFLLRRLFFKPQWLHNSRNAYMILLHILGIIFSEVLYLLWEMEIFWWIHFLLMFAFFFIIPSSKHLHLIFAPLNVFWRSRLPKGAIHTVALDITQEQTCGIKKVEDFTWKQLFDAFSCVKCGICHGQCPAEQSKEWLKPKRINGRLRSYMEDGGFQQSTKESPMKVVGDMFQLDFLASCTTCGGCNNACPISIDHVSKIIDMRRAIVSEKEHISPEAKLVFQGVETTGNPWGKERNFAHLNWAKKMGIPTVEENPHAEYLFFLGCQGTFDESAQQVAASFVKVLKAANIDFCILGENEWCCGETVRRMGNELLFQKTVRKNVETFNKFNIKKILTTCPHCFNTFKNEYPEFGGSYEVIPHAVFLLQLMQKGKLCFPQGLTLDKKMITFQDPCYLSHHNEIFKEPRVLLSSIPGFDLVEMKHNKATSFCCGGGGGRYWEGKNKKNPITNNRIKEALATNADYLVTACPHCHAIFKDNLKKEFENQLKLVDIADFVAESI